MGAEDDLAPGADYFSSTRYPGLILTQAQFDDISSTNAMGGALFLTGLITYADGADHSYRTEFCWYLAGGDATTWHRCRFHNIIQ